MTIFASCRAYPAQFVALDLCNYCIEIGFTGLLDRVHCMLEKDPLLSVKVVATRYKSIFV